MKRTMLFAVLALCAIVFVSAQGNERKGQGRSPYGPPPPPPYQQGQDYYRQRGENMRDRFSRNAESATVSGNLTIVKGRIAVKKDDVTYLTGGLNRFVGFIDGLKEGAAVTLEGKAVSVPQNEKLKFLMVEKMTLNGKEYDLAPPRPNAEQDRGNRKNHPMHPQRRHNGWGWNWGWGFTPYGNNQRMRTPNMHWGK